MCWLHCKPPKRRYLRLYANQLLYNENFVEAAPHLLRLLAHFGSWRHLSSDRMLEKKSTIALNHFWKLIGMSRNLLKSQILRCFSCFGSSLTTSQTIFQLAVPDWEELLLVIQVNGSRFLREIPDLSIFQNIAFMPENIEDFLLLSLLTPSWGMRRSNISRSCTE